MKNKRSIFEDLESYDSAPDYLKNSFLSDVNNIRDTMQIVNHFTAVFIGSAFSLIGNLTGDEKISGSVERR